MKSPNNQQTLFLALFFGQNIHSSKRCINFIEELKGSLDLFQVGFIAQYFPHLVAATFGIFSYLFFIKGFPKPKRILAILSLPITYFIIFRITNYLISDVLSYCF